MGPCARASARRPLSLRDWRNSSRVRRNASRVALTLTDVRLASAVPRPAQAVELRDHTALRAMAMLALDPTELENMPAAKRAIAVRKAVGEVMSGVTKLVEDALASREKRETVWKVREARSCEVDRLRCTSSRTSARRSASSPCSPASRRCTRSSRRKAGSRSS